METFIRYFLATVVVAVISAIISLVFSIVLMEWMMIGKNVDASLGVGLFVMFRVFPVITGAFTIVGMSIYHWHRRRKNSVAQIGSESYEPLSEED